MRLRLALFALVGLLAALPACFLHRKSDTNLLLIVVDGLRFDALSQSIGAARTPNLSALAADGIAYRACYAHSSATLPAHAAILSARVPHTSGVRNNRQAIAASVPLLTEHLNERSWQTFATISTSELAPRGSNQGFDRGCQLFRTLKGDRASAAQVNAQLVSFLETADHESPWFAYVDYSDPVFSADLAKGKDVSARVFLDGAAIGTAKLHDEDSWSVEVNITPGTHRFEMRSEGSFNLRSFEAGTGQARFLPTFVEGRLFAPLSRVVASIVNDQGTVVACRFEVRIRAVQNLVDSRARYKEQVEAVDRAIGDAVAVLKASGHYDDTIIVVTGSHGEALGEHGITGHDVMLYDEVLRVPLVLKPVAGEKRRGVLARAQFQLVRHIDLVPTLLDLLDEPPLPGSEGKSFLAGGQRELLAESHPPEAPGTIVARRDDRYKLIYNALEDRFEMYDVKSDTLEMDNLFALQGHFRSQWQIEMRNTAQSAVQAADLRMAPGPKVGVQPEKSAPTASKK